MEDVRPLHLPAQQAVESRAAGPDGASVPPPSGRGGALRLWWPVLGKALLAAMALIALGWLGARATSLASLGSSLVTQTHTESWLRPVLLPEAKAAHQAPSDGAALAHTSPEGVTLPAAEGSPTAPPAGAPGVTVDGKVILNTASEDELRKLPGVGPARAKAILALRARLHRFRKPTDLLRVKGIGPKTLARMLDHLVVDPPATPTPNAGP